MSSYLALRNDFSSHYQHFIKIGEGSFSTVYKAKSKTTSENVAIKQITKSKLPFGAIDYMQQEIEILQKSKNENIIQFIQHLETNTHLYIIMEYCLIDLESLWRIHYQQKIPEQYVILILKQLINGFSFLHSNFIIHRDIKLENILVQLSNDNFKLLKQGQLEIISEAIFKIADLGLAKQLKSEFELTSTYAGSPLTMAPEIILNKEYGIEADMYSLGVISYQMLFGQYPYESNSKLQQQEVIELQNAQFTFDGVSISEKMEQLIRKMLKYQSNERISWSGLLEHPFFNNQILKQATFMDVYTKKNKTFYQNQASQFKQKDSQLIQQQQQVPQFQEEAKQNVTPQILILEGSDEEEDDVETLQIENQIKVFIERLYFKRNQYILIQRSIRSLTLISNEEKLFDNYHSYLYSVSEQLYQLLSNSIANDENILKVSNTSWEDVISSEQYQYLKELVLQQDSKLFTDIQEPEPQNQNSSFFSFIYNAAGKFFKIKKQQVIDFHQEYKTKIMEVYKILLSMDEKNKQSIPIKINLINILNIIKLFEYNISDCGKLDDIEQEIFEQRIALLDEKIRKLQKSL